MNEVRLRIVDPDQENRTLVKTHALHEGFTVDEAADGILALKLFRRNEYGIVIMETRLPELDAWHVCRQMRKTSELPIVMMSGRTAEEETLSFYDIGIDDFVYKPFSHKELMARLHVILRRSAGNSIYTPRRIIFDGLCIDTVSRVVYKDSESVSLTPREYNLLLYLAQNPNRALSRETILSAVWGEDFFGTDRTVDTHIKSLRESIKPYHRFIETVWGYGYMFRT
jgi:DNA-binding response OmpR family regulator